MHDSVLSIFLLLCGRAGYAPGIYIRVVLAGVPAEFVRHFDPQRPLLLGGVPPGENALGYVLVRSCLPHALLPSFCVLAACRSTG